MRTNVYYFTGIKPIDGIEHNTIIDVDTFELAKKVFELGYDVMVSAYDDCNILMIDHRGKHFRQR